VIAMGRERVFPCTACATSGVFVPPMTLLPFFVKAVRNFTMIVIIGARCQVHDFTGATFTDVIRSLKGSGFALPNLPSLTHVTIAGAIATGTHGSGMQRGMEATVTSIVLDITFVRCDGRCFTAASSCPAAFTPLSPPLPAAL
jgi:hypothetical protein